MSKQDELVFLLLRDKTFSFGVELLNKKIPANEIYIRLLSKKSQEVEKIRAFMQLGCDFDRAEQNAQIDYLSLSDMGSIEDLVKQNVNISDAADLKSSINYHKKHRKGKSPSEDIFNKCLMNGYDARTACTFCNIDHEQIYKAVKMKKIIDFLESFNEDDEQISRIISENFYYDDVGELAEYVDFLNENDIKSKLPKDFSASEAGKFLSYHFKNQTKDFSRENLTFEEDMTQFLAQYYINGDGLNKILSVFPYTKRRVGEIPDSWLDRVNKNQEEEAKNAVYDSILDFSKSRERSIRRLANKLSLALNKKISIQKLNTGSYGTGYKINMGDKEAYVLKVFHEKYCEETLHGASAETPAAIYANNHSNQFVKMFFGNLSPKNKREGFMVTQYLDNKTTPLKTGTEDDDISVKCSDACGRNVIAGKIIDFGGMEVCYTKNNHPVLFNMEEYKRKKSDISFTGIRKDKNALVEMGVDPYSAQECLKFKDKEYKRALEIFKLNPKCDIILARALSELDEDKFETVKRFLKHNVAPFDAMTYACYYTKDKTETYLKLLDEGIGLNQIKFELESLNPSLKTIDQALEYYKSGVHIADSIDIANERKLSNRKSKKEEFENNKEQGYSPYIAGVLANVDIPLDCEKEDILALINLTEPFKKDNERISEIISDNIKNIDVKEFVSYMKFLSETGVFDDLEDYGAEDILIFSKFHYKNQDISFERESLKFDDDMSLFLAENYLTGDDMNELLCALPYTETKIGTIPEDILKAANKENAEDLIYDAIDRFTKSSDLDSFKSEMQNIIPDVEIEKIARGSFGTGYKITSPDIKTYVLKTFRKNIKRISRNRNGSCAEPAAALFANNMSGEFVKFYFGRLSKYSSNNGFMVTQFIDDSVNIEKTDPKNKNKYLIMSTDRASFGNNIEGVIVDFGETKVYNRNGTYYHFDLLKHINKKERK